jgi:RHS repeat-associated protein
VLTLRKPTRNSIARPTARVLVLAFLASLMPAELQASRTEHPVTSPAERRNDFRARAAIDCRGPHFFVITWDFENRLTRVQKVDGTVIQHVYDPDGNRVQTTTTPPGQPPQVVNYLVDTSGSLSQVVAESNAAGQLTAYYVRGDDLLSVIRGTGTRFYHADGLGSIRRLTDEAGNITDGYTYSAFGELLAHTGTDPQPYTFAGEPFDPNSGFSYNRARWMDPRVGRFMATDTWPGSPLEPGSLHPYGYVENNPINRIDAFGLFTAAFGYAVEDTLRPYYRDSHPGQDVSYGVPAGLGLLPGLKPDILNRTKGTWLEIKPFSLSGIVKAGIQFAAYEYSFGTVLGYRPETEWRPPKVIEVPTALGPVPTALFNAAGTIFYSDLVDNVEDLILIKTLSEARIYLTGAKALASALNEFGQIARLAPVPGRFALAGELDQVGTTIMTETLAPGLP